MNSHKEPQPQDPINGSKKEEAILSEDALRQLSKSLTRLIPNDVEIVEKNAFAYGFHKQTEEDH